MSEVSKSFKVGSSLLTFHQLSLENYQSSQSLSEKINFLCLPTFDRAQLKFSKIGFFRFHIRPKIENFNFPSLKIIFLLSLQLAPWKISKRCNDRVSVNSFDRSKHAIAAREKPSRARCCTRFSRWLFGSSSRTGRKVLPRVYQPD